MNEVEHLFLRNEPLYFFDEYLSYSLPTVNISLLVLLISRKSFTLGVLFVTGDHVSLFSCHNKVPQTRRLNNRNVFSQSSGGWKSKIKVLAGLVSSEAPLLGCLLCSWLSSPCVPTQSVLCVCTLLVTPCVQIASSFTRTSQIGAGPALKAISYLNRPLQNPVFECSHVTRY